MNYPSLVLALSTLACAADQPAFRNSAILDKLLLDTATAAYAEFGEREKGTLEPG